MKKLLLAVSGLLAISGSAFAADMPLKAPAPAPAPMSWTGCYIDGGIGYGLYDQDLYESNAALGVSGVTTHDGGRGWLGRVGGGCDYQVAPRWVIGIMGDYDFMNLKGSLSPNEFFPGFTAGAPAPAGVQPITANLNERNAGYIGGRIGYVVAPNVLTYFDGGWSRTRFTQGNLFQTATGTVIPFAYPNYNANGWFVGGGTEISLADWIPIHGLFLRSEYRYASYGTVNLAEFATPSGVLDGNIVHVKPTVQTVTTSLVWRFNWMNH